jgi:hypothetical protein
MIKLKPYPDYTEFENTHYGAGRIYTSDRKFCWPDLEVAFTFEILEWAAKIHRDGYIIPKKYKSALIELLRSDKT